VPSRLRVPVGYLLGALVLVLARPTPRSLLWGLPPVVVGEAIRLWASAHLEKTRTLATGGPYAHTRNPLYVGSLLLAVGMALAAASPWVLLAVLLYFLAFYPGVIREEAAFLREKFGAEYERWAAEVPLFRPRLIPGGPRTSRFEWRRVRLNREWRTAAALPLVALVLYLSAIIRGSTS
jgi:protein-S-isoprenylcysteine O-methyltransferase Ste14